MTSAPAIGFEYRPSRLLPRLLAAVSMLALLAIAACGLAWWMKLLLAVAALACWLRAARRPGDAAVAAAGWAGDGGWTLRRAGDGDVAATLSSSRVLGAFVLLRLRDGERRTATLLLGPDNSDADIRRRLRMRLALARSAEAPSRP